MGTTMTNQIIYPEKFKDRKTSWGFYVPKSGLLRFEQEDERVWVWDYYWTTTKMVSLNTIPMKDICYVPVLNVTIEQTKRREFKVSVTDGLQLSDEAKAEDGQYLNWTCSTLRKAMMIATTTVIEWRRQYFMKAIYELRKRQPMYCSYCGHDEQRCPECGASTGFCSQCKERME